MTIWTSDRVSCALDLPSESSVSFTGIVTDTRTLTSGSLFVALVGDRFDGHDFLMDARDAGAAAAVVRRGTTPISGLRTFEVADTLEALGALARQRRRMVQGPVVGITGTNGKTSTKEMFIRALSTRWIVHGTHENENNLVGVPMTILAAPPECEALVVEIGANLPGEVGKLRDILEPSLGVVTNVSAGHLEGFGSIAGVLEEKISLLDGTPMAVVGTEPSDLGLRARSRADRVLAAGTGPDAEVRPDKWSVNADGRGWLTYHGARFDLPLVGRHQVENAMLAIGGAVLLDLDIAEVAAALAQLSVPSGRCEVIRCGGLTILKDCYNSNPSSLIASLETVSALRGGAPLVVVLGTMLELGHESVALHAKMTEEVMKAGPQLIAASGDFVPAFVKHAVELGDRLVTEDDPEVLGRMVAERIDPNAVVLVKGSRGVHLERVIPYLTPRDGTPCSTIS